MPKAKPVKAKPKVYYHISFSHLGDKVVLTAKTPHSGYREPKTPRVCFCPTIVQCAFAVAGAREATTADLVHELLPISILAGRPFNNPSVYKTTQPLSRAISVADSKLTGEKWSREDIEVKFAGYIDLRALVTKPTKALRRGESVDFPLTKEAKSKLSRAEFEAWTSAVNMSQQVWKA